MREFRLRVGDDEMRREIVEGPGRVGKLMLIPGAEPLRITAGGD
jgi:hypothetical protein